MKEDRPPGTPAQSEKIPLAVPEVQGTALRYVKECLDTNWVSSAGGYVDRFEEEVAERTGRDHGVAMASGTAALHVALRVAGVGPGDGVLVSDLTFIAPANSVRYLGARPFFVDAEPEFLQMDPDALRDFLQNHCEPREGELVEPSTGCTLRAVVPVHLLGHPCDMDAITEIAERHNLAVVEDASQSLGARYEGQPVGGHGDLACFSFNGNKIVTSGGGGMLVTDRQDLAERARHLSTQAKADEVEYVHDEVGYNYRLTNIQAALGLAQLEKLEEHVAAKRRIAARYEDAVEDIDGIVPMPEAPWGRSTRWLYTVQVRPDEHPETRRSLQKRFHERGIQVRPLWQPMHESPAHETIDGSWPVAEKLRDNCLSLPSSVGLSAEDQDEVIDVLTDPGTNAPDT